MDRRSQLVFLLLVAAQAAHSGEEYVAGLYSVFSPAAYVSALFSADLPIGFAIANGTIVAVGVLFYLGPIRRGGDSARAWAWPWVVLEGANGIGHLLLALAAGGYFPGVLTAPLLVVVSGWLGWRMASHRTAVAEG
jgi:hypothetical protein